MSNVVMEGIILASILFFMAFITGVAFGDANIYPTNIQPPLYYILGINLGCCMLMLLSGLLLGIPSTAFLLYNGYITGAKIKTALTSLGLSEVVIRLFPHFFTEIIAIVLSASIGTSIVIGFIKKRELSRNDLILVAVFAIVMTTVSSFIEVYITNRVAILSEVLP